MSKTIRADRLLRQLYKSSARKELGNSATEEEVSARAQQLYDGPVHKQADEEPTYALKLRQKMVHAAIRDSRDRRRKTE